MKTLPIFLRGIALGGWLVAGTSAGFAQVRPEKLSAEGYWTVETNQFTNDYALVRFFDAQDELLYEERLEGMHLDIRRKKTVKLLNHTLQMLQHRAIIARQLKNYQNPAAAQLARKRE